MVIEKGIQARNFSSLDSLCLLTAIYISEFITTKKWILKKGEDRNDTLHQGMPALVGMLLEAARYGDAI